MTDERADDARERLTQVLVGPAARVAAKRTDKTSTVVDMSKDALQALRPYGITDAKITDPAYWRDRNVRWVPTRALDPEQAHGFRLDIALDTDGTVVAARVVPVTEQRPMPPDVARMSAAALADLDGLAEVAADAAQDRPQLPQRLQKRVDQLRARWGKKRPSVDSIYTPEFNQVILDVEEWAAMRGLVPNDVIEEAFGVSRASAARWRSQAKAWRAKNPVEQA